MFGNSIILLATMTQRAHEKMDQTYSMSYKYHGISERRKSSHARHMAGNFSSIKVKGVWVFVCNSPKVNTSKIFENKFEHKSTKNFIALLSN